MLRQRLILGATLLVTVTALACSDRESATITADGAGSAAPADSDDDHHITLGTDRVVWGPAPPIFPAGAQLAVLDGDPSKAGEPFTVRLRLPNGYVLPAHMHPTDEYVTVIRGHFLAGLGRIFAKDSLEPFKAGDFVTMPANMAHYASALGITELQIQGVGPFTLSYVNPTDRPVESRH